MKPRSNPFGETPEKDNLKINYARNNSMEAKAALAESFCVAREGISSRSGETKRLPV